MSTHLNVSFRTILAVVLGLIVLIFSGAIFQTILTQSGLLNIVIFGIVLGIIAGYYREQTNSLIPAIMVHMCFNIGGSLLGLFI